ncbi:MAG: TadE family protein [Candidatus Eisenbacteria bacterium]
MNGRSVFGVLRGRRRRGQAVIEFALVLPILLLVLLGITEFGRAFWTLNVLTQAAREGARLAAVGGNLEAVETRVEEVLDASRIEPVEGGITLDGPDPSDPDQRVTVSVTSNFNVLSRSILPITGTIPLTGTAVMRFEG